eukprot:TRINITY_DN411_c0_g1_i1.p1 TRINITY_DN411_c0_g1~~TRINITY_DN411_c0_g1_i1.p1  ORF type:complete len:904 (+),score=304.94 TRINITY_DN411_c0_g1_i1:67-2712(+)
MSAPPEKKARTEEEVKATEPEPEREGDAPAAKGPKVQGPVSFNVPDTTMNVLPYSEHNIMKSLSEGGVQYLVAGARANVGMKAGRYMFEVKPIEYVRGNHQAKQSSMIRMGVATAEGSLLIGEDNQSVCFDAEGAFVHAKQSRNVLSNKRAPLASVFAVLVNLDKDSPNFNTISLFKDGERASAPQALPESLQGKTLFPAVAFKHATVHVHFGPEPLEPLPFVCRCIGGADKADVVAAQAPAVPKDGKYEVVYPMGLPAEGAFDWLDMFLQKNPHYTEISDRSIIAWALQSGHYRKGGSGKGSIDRPEFNFGIKELEDGSARRALMKIAPVQQRNFVIMELKGNMVKAERDVALQRFPTTSFKQVAYVLLGEPAADFKKYSQELILKDKQVKSDLAFRAKKIQEKTQKMAEKKKKEQEILKKKAEIAKKKAALEKAKEAAAAAAAKKEGEEKAEDGEAKEEKPAEDFEAKEEEIKKEEEELENEKPDEEMPDQDEEPPKVTLDDDEKKLKFRSTTISELAPQVFNVSFPKFALPDKEEAFDDVKYLWSKNQQAAEYLKKYILTHKLTSRIEDTNPSKAFKNQLSKFQLEVKTWTTKQSSYKSDVVKKLAEKRAKALKKEAEEKAAAAKKEAAAKSEEAEKKEEEEASKVEEEKKKEEEEAPEEEVDFDGVDIFAIEDITNIGGGVPLFRDFLAEDWSMLNLRFELYLLCHSIRIDANDPDRTGIYIDHLSFYYQKYFGKALSPKDFGAETCEELIELVSDTLYLTSQKVLQTLIPEEMEKYGIFVRLTEEARRHRALLIDSGAETARLKVTGTKLSNNSNKGGNAGNKAGYGFGGKGFDASKGGGKWGGKWDGGKGSEKGGYGKWQSGGKASGPYNKAWGK